MDRSNAYDGYGRWYSPMSAHGSLAQDDGDAGGQDHELLQIGTGMGPVNIYGNDLIMLDQNLLENVLALDGTHAQPLQHQYAPLHLYSEVSDSTPYGATYRYTSTHREQVLNEHHDFLPPANTWTAPRIVTPQQAADFGPGLLSARTPPWSDHEAWLTTPDGPAPSSTQPETEAVILDWQSEFWTFAPDSSTQPSIPPETRATLREMRPAFQVVPDPTAPPSIQPETDLVVRDMRPAFHARSQAKLSSDRRGPVPRRVGMMSNSSMDELAMPSLEALDSSESLSGPSSAAPGRSLPYKLVGTVWHDDRLFEEVELVLDDYITFHGEPFLLA